MEFKVVFHGDPKVPQLGAGLKELDASRMDFPSLMPKDIDDFVKPSESFLFVLSEEQARRSGRFHETSLIDVCCPDEFLSTWCVKHRIDKNSKGQLSYAWGLNPTVIEAWIQTGSPIRWGWEEGEK